MSNSETKILRGEIARLVTDNMRLVELVSEVRAQNAGLAAENKELKTRITYYENPHSLPSHGSIPSRQRQKARSAQGSSRSPAPLSNGKPGRKAGHKGVSSTRKADKTVHHGVPDRCPGCGSADMKETSIATKMVIDIGSIPRCITTAHVIHESVCDGCSNRHVPPIPVVPGTSVGHNLLAVMVQLHHRNLGVEDIGGMVDSLFRAGLCKGTVQHALKAASDAMEPHAEQIRKDLEKSQCLHIDGTPFPVAGSRSSHAWMVVGDDLMHVTVAGTRGGAVPDASCPFFPVPLTCDGYAPYRRFGTIQRCWAHILRDAEYLADRGRAGEPPYRQLRPICHNAKRVLPDEDHDSMTRETEIAAAQYGALGHSFGARPADAAPDLFTFMSHPGMEPTNNTAERALRRTARGTYGRDCAPQAA